MFHFFLFSSPFSGVQVLHNLWDFPQKNMTKKSTCLNLLWFFPESKSYMVEVITTSESEKITVVRLSPKAVQAAVDESFRNSIRHIYHGSEITAIEVSNMLSFMCVIFKWEKGGGLPNTHKLTTQKYCSLSGEIFSYPPHCLIFWYPHLVNAVHKNKNCCNFGQTIWKK